ncbi:hypothetical protein LXL04_009456 [Taraxacum kok-saghyz]
MKITDSNLKNHRFQFEDHRFRFEEHSDGEIGSSFAKQQIYGSILDLNPSYSISALVAYWNGLSYADKEKLLLGLLLLLISPLICLF